MVQHEGHLSAQLGAIGAALQALLSRAQSPSKLAAAPVVAPSADSPALPAASAPQLPPPATESAAAAALRAAPVRLLHPLLVAPRAAAPVDGRALHDPHESALGFVLASKPLAAAADPFARLRGHSPFALSSSVGGAALQLPQDTWGHVGSGPPAPAPSTAHGGAALGGAGGHSIAGPRAPPPPAAAATDTIAWAAAVPSSLAHSSRSLAGGSRHREQPQQPQQPQQPAPVLRATAAAAPHADEAAAPSATVPPSINHSSALLVSDLNASVPGARAHSGGSGDGEATQLLESGLGPLLGRYFLDRGDGDEASRPSAGDDDSPASTAALRPAQQQALGRAKAALRALAGTVREHALRTVEPGW